jgi:hypothetical protein
VVFNDRSDTEFTRDWQFAFYGWNKGMDLSALIATLSKSKALFNSGGLSDDSDPRANYLSGKNLSYRPPKMDKLRGFNLDTHTGTEVYSLTVAIQSLFTALKRRSFTFLRRSIAKFTSANALRLTTFDGNQPPPLNPGWSQPKTLEEVDIRAYAITPATHRWMFLDCKNVRWKAPAGAPKFLGYGPWANGLVRDWLGDGKMHTFFPLVSKYEIITPLSWWKRVDSFPSPFRQ